MLNVLIIGPTGYLGSAFAHQLFRSGNHEVKGLASTESDGFRLALEEIIPVVGSVADTDSVLEVVRKGNIDVIVETTSFNNDKAKFQILNAVIGAGRQILASSKNPKSSRLGFVTVSAIWSHGSTEDPFGSFKPGKENSLFKVDPPADLPTAKARYEDEVLAASSVLDVAVIRPAFIFGLGGAAWTRSLAPIVAAAKTASSDPIRVPTEPGTFANFVNIHDAAAALEAAVDKLQLFSGTSVVPVFDIVSERFDMRDLFVADARIFGAKGTIEQYKPDGVQFVDAIGRTSEADSSKAKLVLGWEPKRAGFVKDTHIYANSYLAALKIAAEEQQKLPVR